MSKAGGQARGAAPLHMFAVQGVKLNRSHMLTLKIKTIHASCPVQATLGARQQALPPQHCLPTCWMDQRQHKRLARNRSEQHHQSSSHQLHAPGVLRTGHAAAAGQLSFSSRLLQPKRSWQLAAAAVDRARAHKRRSRSLAPGKSSHADLTSGLSAVLHPARSAHGSVSEVRTTSAAARTDCAARTAPRGMSLQELLQLCPCSSKQVAALQRLAEGILGPAAAAAGAAADAAAANTAQHAASHEWLSPQWQPSTNLSAVLLSSILQDYDLLCSRLAELSVIDESAALDAIEALKAARALKRPSAHHVRNAQLHSQGLNAQVHVDQQGLADRQVQAALQQPQPDSSGVLTAPTDAHGEVGAGLYAAADLPPASVTAAHPSVPADPAEELSTAAAEPQSKAFSSHSAVLASKKQQLHRPGVLNAAVSAATLFVTDVNALMDDSRHDSTFAAWSSW